MKAARRHFSIIILAAGASRRYGQRNKLLQTWKNRPLLQWVVDASRATGIPDILLVTGHESDEILQSIEARGLRIVHAENWRDGLSASLKTGVGALASGSVGCLVCLGDMPEVGSTLMREIFCAAARAPGVDAVIPCREKKRGNPVFINRRLFSDVATLRGDHGARILLETNRYHVKYLEVGSNAIFNDVDTTTDLQPVC